MRKIAIVSSAAIHCHRPCVRPVGSSALAEKRPSFMFMLVSFQVRPFNRLGAHREAAAGDQFLAFKELALPPVFAVTAQRTREASTALGEGPLHVAGRWASRRRRFRVPRGEGIISHDETRDVAVGELHAVPPAGTVLRP